MAKNKCTLKQYHKLFKFYHEKFCYIFIHWQLCCDSCSVRVFRRPAPPKHYSVFDDYRSFCQPEIVGNRIMQIRFSLGHVICKLRRPGGKKHGGDVTNLWTQGGSIKSKEVINSGHFLLVYRVNVPHKMLRLHLTMSPGDRFWPQSKQILAKIHQVRPMPKAHCDVNYVWT